ncbi:hypothetical protein M91_09765, partial [Bos mutus]
LGQKGDFSTGALSSRLTPSSHVGMTVYSLRESGHRMLSNSAISTTPSGLPSSPRHQ